jgi:hypothetical protein
MPEMLINRLTGEPVRFLVADAYENSMTPLGDDITWRLYRSETVGHAVLEVETSHAYTSTLISRIHIEGRYGVLEQGEDYDIVMLEDARATLVEGDDITGELGRWRELERRAGIELRITAAGISLVRGLPLGGV